MEAVALLAIMVVIMLYYTWQGSRYEAGIEVDCDECHLDFSKTYMRTSDRDYDAEYLTHIHAGHKGLHVNMWEGYFD